jgi:hypothetical protein
MKKNAETVGLASLTCTVPGVRMVVIEARTHEAGKEMCEEDHCGEAVMNEDETLCSHVNVYQVVGVETGLDADGEVIRSPQVVVGGSLTSLRDARKFSWHRSSADATVICGNWGPDLDNHALQTTIDGCVRRSQQTELSFLSRRKSGQ